MKKSFIILFSVFLVLVKNNFAQYSGGFFSGFAVSPACVSLNNVNQSFVVDTITGNTLVCLNGYEKYSAILNSGYVNNYLWVVPEGSSVISGQGSSTVFINFAQYSGDIIVEFSSLCQIQRDTLPVQLINCPMYAGSMDDGFDISSNCTGLNGITSTFEIGSIEGSTVFCPNMAAEFNIPILSGTPTVFEWFLPPGASIISGLGTDTILVRFEEEGGDIYVEVSDGCEVQMSERIFVANDCKIYKGGLNDGVSFSSACTGLNGSSVSVGIAGITGSSTFCRFGTESYTASVTGIATNYFWIIPDGASFIQGQGSQSIMVIFGAEGGNVEVIAYNYCGADTASIAVSPVSGDFYYGGADDGLSLESTCTNLDGISSDFTLNPITGTAEFCQNSTETYFITTATGSASFFVWTVPSDAVIVSGQGSNVILVAFGNEGGSIFCEVSNSCHLENSTPFTLTALLCTNYLGDVNDGSDFSAGCVDLNGIPALLTLNNISGPSQICPYNTETYTITEATGLANLFYWTVPNDAVIISGQGSRTLSVRFGEATGNIVAEASNLCETVASDALSVTHGMCTMYMGGSNDGYVCAYTCGDLNAGYTPIALNAISGSAVVCPYSTGTYSISLTTGFASTFYWNVPSGSSVISGQGSNTVVIQFGPVSGNVTVEVSNGCELVISDPLVLIEGLCPMYLGNLDDGSDFEYACTNLDGVTVSLTLSAITGPSETCEYTTESYSINVLTGAAQSYFWTVPAGATIVNGQFTNSVVVYFGNASGDVSVMVNGGCDELTVNKAITFISCPMYIGNINDGFSAQNTCYNLNGLASSFTISDISGTSTLCYGSEATFSVSLISGYVRLYEWKVPNGALILSGQYSSSIVVRFGSISGNVEVMASSFCTSETKTFEVTPFECPSFYGGFNDGFNEFSNCTDLNGAGPGFSLNAVTGPVAFCSNTSENYSISLASGTADNYEWFGPPGSSVTSGQGTENVTFLFGDYSGEIYVIVSSGCQTITSNVLQVTNSCGNFYGDSNDGFGFVTGCGTLNGGLPALSLNPISGNDNFCNFSTETYTANIATGAAISFQWTVPSDAFIVSGQGTAQILVSFGVLAGNIFVTASNGCESVNSDILVVSPGGCNPYFGGAEDGFGLFPACASLNGAIPSISLSEITGPSNFCINGSESYTVNVLTGSPSSYIWSVPSGANILSGQNTNAINVFFGGINGNVIVTASNICSSDSKILGVSSITCPMFKGGENDGYHTDKICSNLNGSNFAFTLGEINGPYNFCPYGTENYSISSTGYVVSYLWQVPDGATILLGQGTSSITIQYGLLGGNISVEATNNCDLAVCTPLAVSPISCTMYAGGNFDGFSNVNLCSDLNGSGSSISLGPIVGSSTFCPNSTESYSVSVSSGFSDMYNWTVPSGSNVVSGQGSNTVLIQFGNISGNITVAASNACETVNSAPLAVTVVACKMYAGGTMDGFSVAKSTSDIPLPIVLYSFNAYILDSTVELNWSTASEINSAFFIIERTFDFSSFENFDTISAAGMSNKICYYKSRDYHPGFGLNYYRLRMVDFNGDYCFSSIFPVYYGKLLSSVPLNLKVFPNPFYSGQMLTMALTGLEKFEKIIWEIRDIYGNLIFKTYSLSDNYGNLIVQLQHKTNSIPSGMYIVSVSAHSKKISARIIKL